MNRTRFVIAVLMATNACTFNASAKPGLRLLDTRITSVSGSASFPGEPDDSYSYTSVSDYGTEQYGSAWAQHALARSEIITTFRLPWGLGDDAWPFGWVVDISGFSSASYDQPGGYAKAVSFFEITFDTDAPWMFSGRTTDRGWIQLMDEFNNRVFDFGGGGAVNALVNPGTYRVVAQSVCETSYNFDSEYGSFYLTIPSPGPISLALLSGGLLCPRRRRAAQ
jgi:hypothetical protein